MLNSTLVLRHAKVALVLGALPFFASCEKGSAWVDALGGPGQNPSSEKLVIEPSIPAELAEHTKHFEPKVYKIGDNVYSAVGHSLANTVMIEGRDGIILVDVGGHMFGGEAAKAELRKITDKPVKAIVYTHFHPDHWGGVKAWVSEEDVKSGKVDIIAHETLLGNVVRQGGLVGPILSMRSAYSFGVGMLSSEQTAQMNGGIGPSESQATQDESVENVATFIAPTRTFADTMNVTIAGVRMEFFYAPSEAPDEIAIYLPDSKTLLSAEVIQGPTLPNIHTLRGTKFRDPVQWVKSIDLLRSKRAVNMVPSHGQPVYGKEKVEEVLRMTRDGIQFVHDQTIRHMNKGLTPDELAEAVKFPPHLETYKPYLRQYYGSVKHSVRQVYTGYLGWFEGDPVDLDPTPFTERAQRTVDLMGGRNKVLRAASKAFDEGDNQWVAELTTLIIRIDHDDMEARRLKAASYRRLGYASININWRNWYLAAAEELDGNTDQIALLIGIARIFSSPDVIASWPGKILVEGLSPRLKAEETLDLNLIAGFVFSDTGEKCGLEIRRGVAQFHEKMPRSRDLTVTTTRATLIGVGTGQLSMDEALNSGALRFEGDSSNFERFFSSFESPIQPIYLSVR